ncbi:histone-lysine N-methyltransferase, H3 lysine-79 specific isoform X2 [Folsomia candida]|uniref:histone-lysine N-methyltransferase, H3 lysine-79 specific isoform X2 n=1 Tax=Folsomia candida TaxID=158441 RepID=UPI00160533C8|nr:histone-lysine N-methyltransferase, H3 lysine-79 specific isoform X2 [Folsomia candida]
MKSAASQGGGTALLVGQLVSKRMNSLLLPSPKVPPPAVEIYAEDTSRCDISEGDIEEFAKLLGIDLDQEPHFRSLVEEGLLAPLPPEWKPCKDLTNNQFYYFNLTSNESQWEHPLNEVYREKVLQLRQDRVMNRIQELPPTTRPPKKNLPPLGPLKKVGVSRPPSSLGGGRPPTPANRLDDNLTLNRVTSGLGVLTKELEQYDLDQDADLPPPSSRMVKKPMSSGLILTGEGANFLKPKVVGDQQPPPPPTSTLSNPLLSEDKSKSEYDETSDNKTGLELDLIPPTTTTKSILNSRKGEEKKLLSDLNIPLKDRHGVKFALDDNTEFKFDPEDSEDASESPQNHPNRVMYPGAKSSDESTDTDENSGRNNNKFVLGEKKNEKISSQNLGQLNLDERKATLRQNMENELTKYKELLEKERKEREAQIKKHTEMTLEEIRSEKDSLVRKARQDFDAQKNIELDKVKRELDLMVKVEVDKLKVLFDKELEERRDEIRKQHDVAMSLLTKEFDSLNDTEKAAVFAKNLSDATIKLNTELKEHKESLRDEQKKQIQQMRDYHQTFIEKLKKDLSSEEVRVQSEHTKRLADIVTSFTKESQDLQERLKEEQASNLEALMGNFETEKRALQDELKTGIASLRNDLQGLKDSANVQNDGVQNKATVSSNVQNSVQNAATSSANVQNTVQNKATPSSNVQNKATPSSNVQNNVQNKATPSSTVQNNSQNKAPSSSSPKKTALPPPLPTAPTPTARKSESDVKILSEKYDQLEKKYSYLKKELRKISDAAAARQATKNNAKLPGLKKDRINSDTDIASVVSMSESDSTTAYPSTYNGQQPLPRARHVSTSSRRGTEDENGERTRSPVDEILVENNDKLSTALKSLETLKQQILEIQQSRPSSAVVVNATNGVVTTTPVSKSGRNNNKSGQFSSNSGTGTRRTGVMNNVSSPNSGQNNQRRNSSNLTTRASNQNNNNRRLRPSKSTPELAGLLELGDANSDPAEENSSHQIVQDAKEFIRTQKERLKIHPPSSAMTATELTLQAIHNSYLQSQHRLPHSKASPEIGLTTFSETESSGVGSMSFVPGMGTSDLLKSSTEKKKISKDIEAICSSLSHMDEQMKLMWSVVNTNPNNSALQGQGQGQGQPLYPRLYHHDPHHVLNNYLPPQPRLTPSNLLNSLDKELQQFKATKEKILSQFSTSSNKNNNNNRASTSDLLVIGSSGDQGIQDKTKDLRDWLEKF